MSEEYEDKSSFSVGGTTYSLQRERGERESQKNASEVKVASGAGGTTCFLQRVGRRLSRADGGGQRGWQRKRIGLQAATKKASAREMWIRGTRAPDWRPTFCSGKERESHERGEGSDRLVAPGRRLTNCGDKDAIGREKHGRASENDATIRTPESEVRVANSAGAETYFLCEEDVGGGERRKRVRSKQLVPLERRLTMCREKDKAWERIALSARAAAYKLWQKKKDTGERVRKTQASEVIVTFTARATTYQLRRERRQTWWGGVRAAGNAGPATYFLERGRRGRARGDLPTAARKTQVGEVREAYSVRRATYKLRRERYRREGSGWPVVLEWRLTVCSEKDTNGIGQGGSQCWSSGLQTAARKQERYGWEKSESPVIMEKPLAG
ncbi:hypothetical protein BDV93DRAFT_514759 [Ceratobasidium sp. AG-I]|nr:hypothetical protein BDV93DRAFT_514759 [Ceratobasidium sp. AG-I]